jgi:hypothetical protein
VKRRFRRLRGAVDPKPALGHWTRFEPAATAQTAPLRGSWSPKTRAIHDLMSLNFLSARSDPPQRVPKSPSPVLYCTTMLVFSLVSA